MALSLADELAGAFDSSDGAVGQSLADEFGLDEFAGEDRGHQHTNGHPESYAEETLSIPRSPLRTIDRNKSPDRSRPHKGSTESDGTYGHTSVSVIDEELDAALYGPVVGPDGALEPARGNGILEANPSGFLGPKLEKDPIVILQSVLVSTSQFRSRLSTVDARSVEPAVDRQEGDISDRLQRLLEHIQESDRIREDQCRELLALVRDGGAVTWEGVDIIEVFEGNSNSGGSTGLRIEMEQDDVGWTGEAREREGLEDGWVDLNHHPPESPQDEMHDERDLDRVLEGSGRRNNSLDSHGVASNSAPALPRQTAELVKTSTDLINSLSSLADTVHSTSSLATATSRQLRGIKAGIDSWRDREAQEDAARVGVDAWERTRLKAGLGGTSTRRALQQEMEGFKKALEDAGLEMDALRQKYRQNPRWTGVFAL